MKQCGTTLRVVMFLETAENNSFPDAERRATLFFNRFLASVATKLLLRA